MGTTGPRLALFGSLEPLYLGPQTVELGGQLVGSVLVARGNSSCERLDLCSEKTSSST
jgi:hypothetical protein